MAYTTIDDPSAHFQTKIYTGNATDDTAYTNDGNSDLQADLIWAKNRDQTVDHVWFDSTRGVTKNVRSNNADVESTNSNYLKSFDSDGFTMGTSNRVNGNTDKMVAWQWKANGGTRTTNTESGSNPGGGYQANTTAGFSIVDYTGTGSAGTMAHGLGAVPHVMIVKCRSVGHHWRVYHHKNTSAPETDALSLNQTDATNDQDYWWNDTAPTSSVFTLGNGDSGLNDDGETHIAYCFTEIQGYSKFGGYTGNNSTDGVYIYCGFKPQWVLIKNRGASEDWYLYDIARADTKGNQVDIAIQANSTSEFNTSADLDFLSNGFKCRGDSGVINDTGSFVYMAFAEHPFVSSEGVPVTAR